MIRTLYTEYYRVCISSWNIVYQSYGRYWGPWQKLYVPYWFGQYPQPKYSVQRSNGKSQSPVGRGLPLNASDSLWTHKGTVFLLATHHDIPVNDAVFSLYQTLFSSVSPMLVGHGIGSSILPGLYQFIRILHPDQTLVAVYQSTYHLTWRV